MIQGSQALTLELAVAVCVHFFEEPEEHGTVTALAVRRRHFTAAAHEKLDER